MKTGNQLKTLALALALSGLCAWQAGAIVAYTTPSGLAGTQQGGSYTLADVFTTSSAISVDALGAFSPNGTFGGTVDVAIYAVTSLGGSVSGSLISPVVAFNGTYAPGTAFQSIAPVVLNGNSTYMVVANNYGVGGGAVNYNPAWDPANGPNPAHTGVNPLVAASGLTFSLNGYFGGNVPLGSTLSGLNQDDYWTSGGPHYGAGNFDFVPVPEAASFAIAGVALLGLVYVGRVYAQRTKLA
jgi:hypothetical protein